MSNAICLMRNVAFATLGFVACSGQPSVPGQNQEVGGTSNGGATGGAATGGTPTSGGAGGSHSGGSSSGLINCGTDPVLTPLANSSATGTGACQGVTVGAFLSAIQVQDSQIQISSVQTCASISSSIGASGGVFAYRTSCGSLRVVVWQGSGDCPAGCIQNDYWYFDSDTNCQPILVRHTTKSANRCSW